MAFTHSLAHGLGATVTSWPPYALIVAGLASLALAQTAYQTDAPLITLPTITVVMPLASLAVGIVVLHETARLNGARIVIMMACLAVAVTALAGLARAGAAVAEASKRPADDHDAPGRELMDSPDYIGPAWVTAVGFVRGTEAAASQAPVPAGPM
jgi:hypothetical protein